MHRFDIISGAPKTFIFQKNTNKNNLGGIFTILFIVMMFLIIYSYLYEYFVNDKYKVSYTFDSEHYDDRDKYYNNDTLYPIIDFNLYLEGNISKNIKILTLDENNELVEIPLGKNHTTTKRVSEIYINIYYKCIEEADGTPNCTLREEDMNKDKEYFNIFNLVIGFNGYYCDHQNPDSPIKRDADYAGFPFIIEDRLDYYRFVWRIIKYSEEHSFSGMLRSTDEYYGGFFSRTERFSIPSEKIPLYYFEGVPYKLTSMIGYFRNGYGNYDMYRREKISIFDPIANICALITTLYGVITFIFCLIYSKNFDSYKIVEKILSNRANLNNKNEEKIGEIELTNKKIADIDDDKKDNLLNVHEKDNKEEKDEINNIKEDKSAIDTKPIFKLPKLHFYNFLYNNIYSSKWCTSSGQEIISSCNNIISKYYSIDAVIYNQLRLENLFRDYKWNNPKLSSIENDDLIFKIKSLSGS